MVRWYSGNQGKAKESCHLFSIVLLDYEFLQKKPIPPSPSEQSSQSQNNHQFSQDLSLLHCLITINGHHLLKASYVVEEHRLVAGGPHSLFVEQDTALSAK